MKNKFSLVLIVSLISCSNAFGGFWDSLSDNVNRVVDMINVPTDHLIKLRSAPVLKEFLHEKKGQFKTYARVPKTIMTVVLAYFTWKNEMVRDVAGKVAKPVKRFMGIKEKSIKRKKDMLKKRVNDWREEAA